MKIVNKFMLRPVAVVSALIISCGAVATAVEAAEPDASGGQAVARRLTPEQYRRTVEDIFGPGIKLGGRFEPDQRSNGLIAVGSGQVSVTASGFEQYDSMARSIAQQVMDQERRDMLMPCKPAAANAPDDKCAAQFIQKAGLLIYRRPLTKNEVQEHVKVANEASKTLKNFYVGLETSLSNMLVSPYFLFRQENVEPDPKNKGKFRLDGYSKATRLSYLLWDTTPDAELLAAAEKGTLHTEKGLAQQVDRMLASNRVEAGTRAFFSDMLGFDAFAQLSKDNTLYPKFTPKAVADAQEQTLRTIVNELVAQHGDYRNIFSTRKTFLTPTLGVVYGVPVVDDRPIGEPEQWVPYEYAEGDPRAGILSQASFVALHSHPGRTSPTLRGKALRELIMCQKVPDPPGNVDFTVVQQTGAEAHKTARARIDAHATEAMCTGCHKIIDPIGLALENFDAIGGFRTSENGEKLDTSGEIDGKKFTDVAGLNKTIQEHPATANCLVNRTYSYAVGRSPAKGETEYLRYLQKSFVDGNYRFLDLLRTIATSTSFYRVEGIQQSAANEEPRKFAARTE